MGFGPWGSTNSSLRFDQPKSPTLRLLLFFIPIYTLLLIYARHRCLRDPGSVFFDPWTGYDPSYSLTRIDEGDAFIEKANEIKSGDVVWKASNEPQLCVGIATVAREGARYFKTSVGTLLDGLSELERSQIHLILFVAHSEPSDHPAFNETWFQELPDQILLYKEDEIDIDHIRELEKNSKTLAKQKALLDYQYLLRACRDVQTPYILMVEDDVIAQDGWYHRTQDAIASAERQTQQIGAPNWLYLRLFYSEEFLGWKSEEWPAYLYYSVLTFFFVAFSTLGARQYKPSLRSYLPAGTILLLSFVMTPLLIILFFAAGRATMLPIPYGVNQMPDSGCCSQAFVFPQNRVSELLSVYESKTWGNIDSITESYANNNTEVRWALTPSIMQHVGRQSSKAEKGSSGRPSRFKSKSEMRGSERLWSFAFEMNDADRLRIEHDRVKEMYDY